MWCAIAVSKHNDVKEISSAERVQKWGARMAGETCTCARARARVCVCDQEWGWGGASSFFHQGTHDACATVCWRAHPSCAFEVCVCVCMCVYVCVCV